MVKKLNNVQINLKIVKKLNNVQINLKIINKNFKMLKKFKK